MFPSSKTAGRLFALIVTTLFGGWASAQTVGPGHRVTVRVDESVQAEPVTGRVFLMIAHGSSEPRKTLLYTFAYYFNDPSLPYPQIFGVDVEGLAPGEGVELGDETLGFPFPSLSDLAPGNYTVQAVLSVYTKFERADGHTLWLHMDRGEGQQFHISPGNLYSRPQEVTLGPGEPLEVELALTEVIPPITRSPDSEFIRRIQIKSELASEFWGRDMIVNATILLPKGYDEHPDVHYPVLYYQGHFFEDPPFNFPEDVPDDARDSRRFYFPNMGLRQAWLSAELPRMIVVTFQHPTPYYDDSYFVDSANSGPWGRVLMEEVLPVVEERFRIIKKSYARVMTGGSTGGWVSAALQVYHPDIFGGIWSFVPDPLDFREFLNMDIYREENAFFPSGYAWLPPERAGSRSVKGLPRVTVRQLSQLTRVLGSRGRSGEFLDQWNALYGPVGPDGYPEPLWDYETGVIDRDVARAWKENGFDLREYTESRWDEIGSDLVGKLHFICGDMDNFYLNLGVYRMENFLESTTDPAYEGSFLYGRPMVGHQIYGYQPWPMAILEEMAEHITENAPEGEDPSSWRYE